VDERDPAASSALQRVRAELKHLAGDEASAPDVPAAVTEQVVSALRAAEPPEPARHKRAARLGAVLGATAVVVAVAVGVMKLATSDLSAPASPPVQRPTTEAPPPAIPLSDAEILALLRVPPDLGPLGDPRRRASCLGGLGYPASTTVLGGRQLSVLGQPAVLLILQGDAPRAGEARTVVALAVRPSCSAADTGLLVQTRIRRP
jgi:hypothetical protein